MRNLLFFLPLLLILSACHQAHSPKTAIDPIPQTPEQYAIATAHPIATQAGLHILKQGGNAFDAAIAIAATLGVVEPFGSGLGGGGFWLLHNAKTQKSHFIDARETAPSAANESLFLTDGRHDRDKAINGATAPGIPGQAAAFDHIQQHYGSLPLSQALQPAIKAAIQGFTVSPKYREMAKWRLSALQRYPEASKQFLYNQQIPALGYQLKQPELAKTLSHIADEGRNGFYRGETAKQLVDSVRLNGGIWTLDDLKNYKIKERAAIISQYKGHTIISAPPPSAGGVLLANMLNMLEPFELDSLDDHQKTHLLAEVMRRAYKERASSLGDPDFSELPIAKLLSKPFAQQQMKSFTWQSASISQAQPNTPEGTHTTHFSVMDTQGNLAAVTLSINLPFGSAFVAKGTGVILNNELDDFAIDQKGTNAYGLTGTKANAIEPNKRPLSSMTPTFIFSKDKTAILGTPGGSRITTMVLLGALEVIADKAPHDWVSRKRFHHQYLPDEIQFEQNGLSADLQAKLKEKGHKLNEKKRQYGNMQAVLWRKMNGTVEAASDPRGEGAAISGSLELAD